MTVTVDKIYREALELPDESKACLAEQLVTYLETHIHNDIERQHLQIVRERRRQLLSGEAESIDGPEALQRARQRLEK